MQKNILDIDIGLTHKQDNTLTLGDLTHENFGSQNNRAIIVTMVSDDSEDVTGILDTKFSILDASKDALKIGQGFIDICTPIIKKYKSDGYYLTVNKTSINLNYEDWDDIDDVLYSGIFTGLNKIIPIKNIIIIENGGGDHRAYFIGGQNKVYNFYIYFGHEGDGYTLKFMSSLSAIHELAALVASDYDIKVDDLNITFNFSTVDISDKPAPTIPNPSLVDKKLSIKVIAKEYGMQSVMVKAAKNNTKIITTKGGSFFSPKYDFDVSKLSDSEIQSFIHGVFPNKANRPNDVNHSNDVKVMSITDEDKTIKINLNIRKYVLYFMLWANHISPYVVLFNKDDMKVSVKKISNKDITSLTLENSLGLGLEIPNIILDIEQTNNVELTIESALEALHQDVKMVEQYYGILTTEDSIYVNKLKPFFIDGIQRISSSMSELKDKLYMKSDVFKDKISDLDKYGKFNRNIKNLKFSTYEDMLFPIMLGTNVDYLTASQKLLKYPMLIDGLNNVILDFVHNLEQMMNENSNDRLTLRKHDDRYFNIVDAKNITSELINTLVNPKANSDQMKLEYLLPNFVSLDTIKDNFTAICKDLNKVDISKLEDNVDTLVKTISIWQQVVKEQTDTRHSTYMVEDIKNNTVHIAALVTNIGMLITLTFQYITFYNRLIVILNTKTTSN